jgi:hypothetical protein
MGDIETYPQHQRIPGVAIVRPTLHDPTPENKEFFKRWTKLHLRDTLSIPTDPQLGGATRTMRFKRSIDRDSEEYFYTIHLSDIRLLATEPFQQVSKRLDLENVRPLHDDEEPVFPNGYTGEEKEPMVFKIVNAVVCIFRETEHCTSPQCPYQSTRH